MTESQRSALIGMVNAVLAVRDIDQFTRYRARRLKSRLTGHPFDLADIFA